MENLTNRKRRGFILVLSLLTASVVLILVIPYISRVVADYQFTSKIYNSTAALNLAEAGVERALWEIGYNGMAFTGWSTSTDGDGNTTRTISVNSFQTSTGDSIGDYTVSARTSADGLSSTVTSTGYVPNRISPDAKRAVKVTCARNNFSKAIISLSGITMSGQSYTNSYDSSLGPYNAQPHTQNGDIATNGAISLSGGAYVNGDANPGTGYPFSGTPPVSGSYGTLQAPIVVDPIPPSTVSAARSSNNNGNIIYAPYQNPLNGYDLSVGSQSTITFPGGTYYFTSISVSSQSTINVTGPSTIYVDGGAITISGQGVVNSGSPSNFVLYSTGANITLSGQSAFVGAIYAPSATVKLNGQENFYGSIICGANLDSGQAAIHYDLSLSNVTPVFANNRVTSWQEIQSG